MSVTTEPGDFSREEVVRVDGKFAGRIRRMSSGTYYANGALTSGSDHDRSDAIGHVVSEFHERNSNEARQEKIDRAVYRDQESYRNAAAESDDSWLDEFLDD